MGIREGGYASDPVVPETAEQLEAAAAVVLIDDARLEVVLHLAPFDATAVAVGQTALVGLDGTAIAAAARGEPQPDVVAAKVWAVSPSVSLSRRAVLVRVRSDAAAAGRARDGDFVSVWIAAQARPGALTVPYPAVQYGASGPFVWRVQDGVAARQPVRLGFLGLDRVEIAEGLAEGDEVVLIGQHLLHDGAPVRPVPDAAPRAPRGRPARWSAHCFCARSLARSWPRSW